MSYAENESRTAPTGTPFSNVSVAKRMPSTAAKVVTGVVVALVLAYSLVIANAVLVGVIVSALVALTAWLLSYGRESDAIRSLRRPSWAAASLLAVLVVAYSVVVARNLLVGVGVASLVLLAATARAFLADRGYAPSMGRARTLVVAALSALVLAYALLVARQLLLGLVAVVALYVVAWLTSPTGPVAGR